MLQSYIKYKWMKTQTFQNKNSDLSISFKKIPNCSLCHASKSDLFYATATWDIYIFHRDRHLVSGLQNYSFVLKYCMWYEMFVLNSADFVWNNFWNKNVCISLWRQSWERLTGCHLPTFSSDLKSFLSFSSA